jgi:hypothetical protein
MPQITARLSPEIRARFGRYATEVGLDASELARLLIVKVLTVRPGTGPVSSPSKETSRRSRNYGQRKLTAHFHQAKMVADFDSYARTQGLSRAAAARSIVEQELREQWLLRAFTWNPIRGRRHRS